MGAFFLKFDAFVPNIKHLRSFFDEVIMLAGHEWPLFMASFFFIRGSETCAEKWFPGSPERDKIKGRSRQFF